MPTKYDAELLGRRIGRAIAKDTIADELPREWTGLDPQDGDRLIEAGIEPGSVQWKVAEKAARNTYLAYVRKARQKGN